MKESQQTINTKQIVSCMELGCERHQIFKKTKWAALIETTYTIFLRWNFLYAYRLIILSKDTKTQRMDDFFIILSAYIMHHVFVS